MIYTCYTRPTHWTRDIFSQTVPTHICAKIRVPTRPAEQVFTLGYN